ncbi:MAG: sugar phosphate isomerase/epimerase [Bryobacteraceae bacterium]
MKISLGSWSFTFGPFADRPVPLDQIIRKVAAAGYDGLELCGYPPQVSLEQYATAGARQQLRQLLQDHGLGVSGYSADQTMCNPTAPENAQAYLDLFQRQVDLCVGIGSPMIRIDTVAAPGSIAESDYQSCLDRLAALWHKAATAAAGAGVKVTWEFEPGFVFNKPSEVIALHERVDHPNFKVVFDTAHAYVCSTAGPRQHGRREVLHGGLLEFFDKLYKRIGHVHLVDSDGTLLADETSRHLPFGEGNIDFSGLAPRLLSLHDVDWWCVDLCFCPQAWDLVKPSLVFVENLLSTKPAA